MVFDAILYFWGDNLNPDEISRAVGCAPTIGLLKGQERKHASGKILVAKTGSWVIQTTDLHAGGDLVDHVTYLAYEVCEKSRIFVEGGIIQQARLALILSGLSSEKGSSECFELPGEIISVLSSCKVSVSITVLWPSAEDDIEAES